MTTRRVGKRGTQLAGDARERHLLMQSDAKQNGHGRNFVDQTRPRPHQPHFVGASHLFTEVLAGKIVKQMGHDVIYPGLRCRFKDHPGRQTTPRTIGVDPHRGRLGHVGVRPQDFTTPHLWRAWIPSDDPVMRTVRTDALCNAGVASGVVNRIQRGSEPPIDVLFGDHLYWARAEAPRNESIDDGIPGARQGHRLRDRFAAGAFRDTHAGVLRSTASLSCIALRVFRLNPTS